MNDTADRALETFDEVRAMTWRLLNPKSGLGGGHCGAAWGPAERFTDYELRIANSYSSRDEVARNPNIAESNSQFAMGGRVEPFNV